MKKAEKVLREQLTPRTVQKKQVLLDRSRIFFILLIITTLAFMVLTILVKTNPPFFWIDLQITLWIQRFHALWFDWLMRTVSFLGNTIPGILLMIVSTALLYLYKRKNDAIMILGSGVGITMLGIILKVLVGRMRPDNTLVHQMTLYLRHDSFPSGHVLFFIGFFGFLLLLSFTTLHKSMVRTLILIVLSSLLLLIGISRIYLGAHWVSDVLGAYLLGSLWLALMSYLHKRFTLQGGKKSTYAD